MALTVAGWKPVLCNGGRRIYRRRHVRCRDQSRQRNGGCERVVRVCTAAAPRLYIQYASNTHVRAHTHTDFSPLLDKKLDRHKLSSADPRLLLRRERREFVGH